MSHQIRNVCLVFFLFTVALLSCTSAQQPQQQSAQTGVLEQPGIINYLQGLGLDVDQNTVIALLIGSVVIAVGATGLEALFVVFLMFGRPLMHQFMTQMSNGPPGSNPMDGMSAAGANMLKNLFGGQDVAAIIAKIISTILPALLRSTSQFVTDQANTPQQG